MSFFLLISRSSLYILDNNLLSFIVVGNISSQEIFIYFSESIFDPQKFWVVNASYFVSWFSILFIKRNSGLFGNCCLNLTLYNFHNYIITNYGCYSFLISPAILQTRSFHIILLNYQIYRLFGIEWTFSWYWIFFVITLKSNKHNLTLWVDVWAFLSQPL